MPARVPLWFSITFVLSLVGLLLLVELVARFVIPSVSYIEGRIASEHRQALNLRKGAGGRETTLIAGNSLLGAGVDFKELNNRLASGGIDAKRFIVEGTGFVDWHYGLKNLLEGGAQPDSVVLMITYDQLVWKGFRGSYSAYHLFGIADMPRIFHEMDLGNTDASSLALSNVSAYYGLRRELRREILVRLSPSVKTLFEQLATNDWCSGDEACGGVELAVQRLVKLKKMLESKNSRLIVVEPPTLVKDIDAHLKRFRMVSELSGVEVLTPVTPGEFGAEHYEPDGFHMSALGSKIFTPRLANSLIDATIVAAKN